MKNSEMPAMPIHDDPENGGALPAVALHHADCSGLTKREYFAGLAMQGLCAARPNADYDEIADLAVCHADALLAELENHNDR